MLLLVKLLPYHSLALENKENEKIIIPEKKVSIKQKKLKNLYFVMEEIEAWKVASIISDYYNVNILVYDDIKEKKLSGTIDSNDIMKALETITWLLGVEWILQDEVYYIGGNQETFEVLPSNGLGEELNSMFGEKVLSIGDKAIIKGTEREVKKYSDAVQEVTSRKYINIWLYGLIVTESTDNLKGLKVTMDINPSINFGDLQTGTVEPMSFLNGIDMSIQAKNDLSYNKAEELISSKISILSGSNSIVKVMDKKERPVFTKSTSSDEEGGDTFVSSYDSFATGIIIDLKAFYGKNDDWFIQADINQSKETGENSLSQMQFQNNITVRAGDTVLLNSIQLENEIKIKECGFFNGIWLLEDIFSYTEKREFKKKIYFFISIEDKNVKPKNPNKE